MKKSALLAALAFTSVTACEQRETLPLVEPTVTEIPCPGGVATSADGRFTLRFEEGVVACGTEITVEAIPDHGIDGLVSHVYRVGPEDIVVDGSVEIAYALRGDEAADRIRFVRVDDGIEAIEGARIDADGWTIRARIDHLDSRLFAIHEREPPLCDGLACGWDDTPGSGTTFIVNSYRFAGLERGVENNRLWRLGALLNDQMRQELLGGALLMLVEVAGVPADYRGAASSVSAKLYEALDADRPFFPANNFEVPEGQTECCTFEISRRSVMGTPPQAGSRAPGRIERGRLQTLVPTRLSVPFGWNWDEDTPHPMIQVQRAFVSAHLPAELDVLEDGLITGAISMQALAQIPDPFCRILSPRCPVAYPDATMLDHMVALGTAQPDVDLDGDGLECLLDLDGDNIIDVCCDGAGQVGWCGSTCAGATIAPIDPSQPHTCTLRPEMADGYSVALEITGVRASVVGN